MAAMSFGRRVAFAFRCFFALLFKGIVPADIVEVVAPSAPLGAAARPAATVATAGPLAAVAVDDPGDRAIQLLALFQRDGRLVDFLFEDIAAYGDAQIGAAVREVHASCRRVIDRYLPIEPILADLEGQTTRWAPPWTPPRSSSSATWASRRATSAPCATAAGASAGWRCRRLAASAARQVVTPAEVEIS